MPPERDMAEGVVRVHLGEGQAPDAFIDHRIVLVNDQIIKLFLGQIKLTKETSRSPRLAPIVPPFVSDCTSDVVAIPQGRDIRDRKKGKNSAMAEVIERKVNPRR